MSEKRSIDGLFAGLVALAGAVTAIIAAGERLATFGGSRLFAILYVVADLFWVEAILVLILLAVRGRIKDFLVETWSALPGVIESGAWRQRQFWTLAAIALVSGVIVLNQAYWYIGGKRLAMRLHANVLATRAATAYIDGDGKHAAFLINTCLAAYEGELCEAVQTSMARRAEWVQGFRALLPLTSPTSWSRPGLLLAMYMQDRDWNAYQERLRTMTERFNDARERLGQALAEIEGKNYGQASRLLKAVNDSWPGFGRAGYLLNELEARAQGRGATSPHLDAVAKYGAAQTLGELTAPFTPFGLSMRPPVEATRQWYEDITPSYIDSSRAPDTSELDDLVKDLNGGWRVPREP